MATISERMMSYAKPAAIAAAATAVGYMVKGTEGAVAVGATLVTNMLPDNRITGVIKFMVRQNAGTTLFGAPGAMLSMVGSSLYDRYVNRNQAQAAPQENAVVPAAPVAAPQPAVARNLNWRARGVLGAVIASPVLGYVVDGVRGAIAGTCAISIPAFVGLAAAGRKMIQQRHEDQLRIATMNSLETYQQEETDRAQERTEQADTVRVLRLTEHFGRIPSLIADPRLLTRR